MSTYPLSQLIKRTFVYTRAKHPWVLIIDRIVLSEIPIVRHLLLLIILMILYGKCVNWKYIEQRGCLKTDYRYYNVAG